MPKFFSVLFLVLFSLTAFAQEISMSLQSEQTTGQIQNGAAVLYDQTVGGNTNAYTSQDFEAANDAFDNQIADDFTATDTWTITDIVVTGTYSIAGPADGFNIFFYEDNAGIPGTEVYSELLAPYVYDGVGLFTITMVTPAVLPAGDYWVSVQCNMSFAVGGQWYWNQVDGAYGAVAQWQNPLDGFATGCTTWSSIQSCIAAIGTDQYFALMGTAGGGTTCAFFDDFTAGLGNWTITNDGGTCVWDIFQATEYTMPPEAVGNVMAADADFCGVGTTLYSTAMLTSPIDATMYQTVTLEFDNDWRTIDVDDEAHVEVSTDAGATWTGVWDYVGVSVRTTHEAVDMSAQVALTSFMIRFRTVQPGYDWWWAVDNVCISLEDLIPVELTSFTATADGKDVTLNWATATETNNQGFDIERNSGDGFQKIGYVSGFGTSTETHSYSYVDASLGEGTYTYRLKQIDLDGTFEYSDIVEVDVTIPDVFALEQNYPNPFNPSTKINFSLAVESKVSLKVFDVIGQEVATLINTNLVAGSHNVNFNASLLNSGVYFYRIEATGIDGSNFVDVKKMILTK